MQHLAATIAQAIVKALNEWEGNNLTSTIPTVVATPIRDDQTVRVIKSARYYAELFRAKLLKRGYQLMYMESGNSLSICKVTRIGNRNRTQTYHTFGFHSNEVKYRYLLFSLICLDQDLSYEEIMQNYSNYIRDNGCGDHLDQDTPPMESETEEST
jgi:hypothetical protein